MSLEHLTMKIRYDIKRGKLVSIEGDANEKGRYELISEFLRTQMGAGADKSKPNVQDIYTICLQWYPANDSFRTRSDTGNKSLRDGILLAVLKELGDRDGDE